MLDEGQIRGADLPQTMAGRANQFKGTINVNRTMQMGSAFENLRSSQMAMMLAHENGHLRDAGRTFLQQLFFGVTYGTFYRGPYEASADRYACTHVSGGDPYFLQTCPGR